MSGFRPIDVVVIDAGYAGVIAINRLTRSTIRRSWERGLPWSRPTVPGTCG